MQCMLFDSLVMPILSYVSEVWALDPAAGPEKLHRLFLKQLLRVRNSTANDIVLAELGRYPLQICIWQQILRYHNRSVRLPDSRLVKLALVNGAQLQDGHVVVDQQKQGWRASVHAPCRVQLSHLCVFQYLEVAAIIDGLREAHQSTFYTRDDLSSLV